MPNPSVFNVLASVFLAGEPSIDQLVRRAEQALGRPWRWLRPLAKRYTAAIAGLTRPRHREVVEFLRGDEHFRSALLRHPGKIRVQRWLTALQQMQPVAPAANWDIPPIESLGALAEWLALTDGELHWFADLKGLGYKQDLPLLHHYHYRILAKQFGRIRLIEAPKPRLKTIQRQILQRILDPIPAHPAVHGFVKGRSIQSFAAPHVGQRVVIRMDLEDFFPTFAGVRIQAFFRTAGYPESVADLLGGICTNAVPRDIWKSTGVDIDPRHIWEARQRYARPHLPQGAPTSPTLANLCFYRVDCRLAGLAQSAGARYTRYADDLAFSGDEDFERRAERFSHHVAAILLEEGFTVHHRKTRIMRQGVRQHLAGLVANQRLNVRRDDFDRPEGHSDQLHPPHPGESESRRPSPLPGAPGRASRVRGIHQSG